MCVEVTNLALKKVLFTKFCLPAFPEMALGDIRKSRALTQEQVAKKLGDKRVYVSRLESRSDVKVSTLRDGGRHDDDHAQGFG
jgi:Helix-turn-helix